MSQLQKSGSLAIALALLLTVVALVAIATLFPAQRPARADEGSGAIAQVEYEVIAWNDLGMHCYNPGFQELAVLPPWNTLYAQVIRVGDPPEIVTAGITVEFFFEDNTYSVGKTDFWDTSPYRPVQNAQWLFGLSAPLPPNVGLAGVGMAGEMEVAGDHFIAEGIPLTEYSDSAPDVRDPYQLATVVVRHSGTGQELARVQPVAPVSTEMHCEFCHYDNGPGNRDFATGSVDQNILSMHDKENASDYPDGYDLLMNMRPVLCAWCHASPILGAPGEPGLDDFSGVMHEQHAGEVPNTQTGCYNCHPGPQTECQRGVMFWEYGMTCPDCHGTMEDVATKAVPWFDEPRCDTPACHGEGYGQDNPLYRLSKEHGGMFCEACHDSTHAIAPSIVPEDGIKFVQLQGYDGTLRKCTVCHATQPVGPGPHDLVGPTEPGWDKDITTGGSTFGWYDSPIDVLPGGTLEVVDRLQVSGGVPVAPVRAASTVAYTLTAEWTELLGLVDYQVDAGSVMADATGLTWQLADGMVDTWYTLTRTYAIADRWGELHTMADEVTVDGRAGTANIEIGLQAEYRLYLPVVYMTQVWNQAR